MKHTEILHQLDTFKSEHLLEHGDKMVYAAIRRYMNKDTRECFPAIGTIAINLKCSKQKVLCAIKRLLNTNLIEAAKDGIKNHYYFPETEFDKRFEMFTDEFLDMDLPLNIKEYYMDIQQYLYGKETGIGRCTLSNNRLSKLTGWTVNSVKKYNAVLIEKGLLSEEITTKMDEAGFPIIQKNFDLTALNQAALWVKAVNPQLQANTKDIADVKDDVADLKEQLRLAKAEINELKRQQRLNSSKEVAFEKFTF